MRSFTLPTPAPVFLVLLLLLAGGCTPPTERAKRELQRNMIPFTVDDFVAMAGHGDVETVKLFAQADIGIDEQDARGYTALMLAAERGQIEVMAELLRHSANPNVQGAEGSSALMVAAVSNRLDAVSLLLQRGADPALIDEKGWTAFMKAVYQGHEEIVRALAPGAPADQRGHAVGVAALAGKEAVVRVLLDEGADVNVPMDNGQTPLMFAAAKGNEPMVRLLLSRGANPLNANEQGMTSARIAANKGHQTIARLLEEAEAGRIPVPAVAPVLPKVSSMPVPETKPADAPPPAVGPVASIPTPPGPTAPAPGASPGGAPATSPAPGAPPKTVAPAPPAPPPQVSSQAPPAAPSSGVIQPPAAPSDVAPAPPAPPPGAPAGAGTASASGAGATPAAPAPMPTPEAIAAEALPEVRKPFHQRMRLKEFRPAQVPMELRSVHGREAEIALLDRGVGAVQRVREGDHVGSTRFRVGKVRERQVWDKGGELVDASEVWVEDSTSGEKFRLVKGLRTRSSQSYAEILVHGVAKPVIVRQGEEFALPSDPENLYRVLDLRSEQVVLQLVRTGETFTVVKAVD